MAWVRLHDAALTHPKLSGLVSLSHPFTLWIWGLSYCQMHLTDGLIPKAAVDSRAKRAINELIERGLWKPHDIGYKVHDYLDWNDARESVLKKRSEAKERMATSRERSSRELLSARTSREVLRGVGTENISFQEKGSGEKPPDSDALDDRAARFLDRYQALYREHRHGAHVLIKPSLDFQRSCDLCRAWPDARLEKMAVILLTTDEEWVMRTDRGFGVFVSRATWCDDKLKQWEVANGVAV